MKRLSFCLLILTPLLLLFSCKEKVEPEIIVAERYAHAVISAAIFEYGHVYDASGPISLEEGESINVAVGVGIPVVWRSSNEKVARVDKGLIKAEKEGNATITVNSEYDDLIYSFSVNVYRVESLSLNQSKLEMVAGESTSLVVTVNPESAIALGLTWSSSDETVATVDQSGKVIAVREGSAVISAKIGKKEASCAVTVTMPIIDVDGIILSQESLIMYEGETSELTATIFPDDATDKTVTWGSSNSEVVSVDQNGTVTALKIGKATVSATAGEQSATCIVNVQEKITASKYLTFTSEWVTTISLSNTGGNAPLLYYSRDKTHWVRWDYSALTITDKAPIYICGDNSEGFSQYHTMYSSFVAQGNADFSIDGDIMSLINKDEDVLSIPNDYCFYNLFADCILLKKAPELPATTLSNHCYDGMFSHCEDLVFTPELPATTLASSCYESMFTGSGIITPPELPALSLAERCYQSMFSWCQFTKAPELPATDLATECYYGMFFHCLNLTDAPQLPASSLAKGCYSAMFDMCANLTVAPILPATTLDIYCYAGMFRNCVNLSKAPELPALTLAYACYENMFYGCSKLLEAPELPALTMAPECYRSMFTQCNSIKVAPALPATKLAGGCYYDMFSDCIKLTVAPDLPALTMENSCYWGMFSGCINLIEAPELPAMTLASYCYYAMFSECTHLTVAPKLPATTLSSSCYCGMFYRCISLTEAPNLPATSLVVSCYQGMFNDCRKLNYVKCMATNVNASDCVSGWLYGVASSGTFVKAESMYDWPKGANGIPEGWTVIDAE